MPDEPTDASTAGVGSLTLVQEEIADRFARNLLKAQKEGQLVLDQKTGKLVKIDATSAMMNVTRQYLRDINMNADPVKNKTLLELQALANRKTVDGDFPNLPEHSDEKDELVG